MSSSRHDRKRHNDEDRRDSHHSKSRDSQRSRDERPRDSGRDYDRDRKDYRSRGDYSRGTSEKYDRSRRSPTRYDRNERNDRNDRDRRRPDDRDRGRDDRKDKRRDRSRTRSPVSHKSSSKKSESPKHPTEDARLFDRILDPNYKAKSSTVLEIQDVEMSPVELKEETEISTFTFDDDCGPARPTGVSVPPENSEPVSDEERPATPTTPVTPDNIQEDIDGADETIADLNETISDQEDAEDDDSNKYDVTPEPEKWDELSDEEKTLHKQAMKRRKKQRSDEAISKLPVYYPGLHGCQHIAEYAILNVIAEGTYGEVFRGKNTRTDEIVALKRFKMEKEKEGFPITALREINMLLKAGSHENIVNVREILLGRKETDVYMAMEYVEHDMKSLIDKMKSKNQRFRTGQQKRLMLQLLSGIEHMHNLWILHRDLKTSNLLISHSGVLKIADFGLSREFGEASNIETRMRLTPVVVTLWYRSIELLLEPKTYSTPVDMWSVGCIMAEFILMSPLFRGTNEPNQVDLIFQMMGTPNENAWPEIKELRIWNTVEFPKWKSGGLKKLFRGERLLNESGFELLEGLLSMNPRKRLTASEALDHKWFDEHPVAVSCDELPTYPAKSELNAAPPQQQQKKKNRLEALLAEEDPERAALLRQFNVKADQVKTSDFQLKF